MSRDLVADSSFYICFLDDISFPEYLIKILKNFIANLPPTVYKEIEKSKNSKLILENKKIKLNIFKGDIDLGEPLKPFFSKEQKERGEHELIVIAHVCYNMKIEFVFIIDDGQTRKFIKKNFLYLYKILKGTIDFICDCCCEYRIFKKEESIDILNRIEKSKFRVSPQSFLGF